MNYENELNELKENLDRAKNLKYRAEARLEELKKQEKDIIEELKTMNISPDNLDKEIANLKYEIESLLKEANENLPKSILEK